MIAIFGVVFDASLLTLGLVSERYPRGWRDCLRVSLLTLFLDIILVIFSFFRMQIPYEN